MITQHQLEEAIAEMQGQRKPDANTCIKLASYYTIRNELYPREAPVIDLGSSYDSGPQVGTITYDSGTEFSDAIRGRSVDDVLAVLDEVIKGVFVVDPALYRRIMRDLRE